jgi:NAD-dependent dihydropyrimidine dehydrogenase PreA subunit
MAKRKIIEIDRDKCNGCGLCTTACAEGALALDQENKAVLLTEIYCDGMGACLDVCPTGALEIIERESKRYSAAVAYEHVLSTRGSEAAGRVHGVSASASPDLGGHPAASRSHLSGCPGSRPIEIPEQNPSTAKQKAISGGSELRQWPIQLHLVSPYAPCFKSSDLLLAADCTAFAFGSFHQNLLKGKTLIIACPKLDDTTGYVEKLADIIKQNALKSLTVAIMTVPCCSGLYRIAEEALALSGVDLNLKRLVIPIDGKMPR